jgi:hypothetical protein
MQALDRQPGDGDTAVFRRRGGAGDFPYKIQERTMNESGKHLYVCAIGPVQDFIANARTSQDLWFGSWMLSELSKAAAKSISTEPHQLIFPAPEQDLEPGSALSVANKIVGVLPASVLNSVAGHMVW